MKRLLSLVCVAIALVPSALARPTITINGEAFTLAQEERYSDVTVREFLPAPESYPKWNRMAVVRELYAIEDPRRHIESFAEKYRAENPGVKFELFQDKATGGWVIDCFETSDEPGNRYAQWNVWRATKAKKGIVVYEYAERLYFNESALEVKDAFVKLRRDKAAIVSAADFQQTEEPDEAPIAKPTIAIHGEVFTLFQEERRKEGGMRLFLPDQEPSAKRSRTLTVSQLKLVPDTKAYITSCARIYQQENPGKKFEMFQSEVTGDWVMDCVRPSRDPKERVVDWTVYRAHRAKEGIVAYMYITRLSFSESAEELTNELAQLRAEIAPILYATSFCEREMLRKAAPAPAPTASATATPSTKPTIKIGDEIFTLDKEERRPEWTARHFLLAQESSPQWRRLVSVREFLNPDNDPKEFVAALERRYRERDPNARFDTFQNKATGDWVIDFLTTSPDPADRFVEWNVYRARKAARGMVVYHYAARFYFKESSLEVGDEVAMHRAKMTSIVYAADFQEKKVPDNAPVAPAVAIATAVATVQTAPAKPTITIGRETFTLASQEGTKEGALREFLLARESFDKWTRFVAVREFKALDDPKRYIVAMAQEYQKHDPGMKFDLFQSRATGAWVIDFLSAPEDSESRFVEWNVFRAQPAAQGIVVHQYAARLYFKESAAEIRDALANLRAEMAPIVYAADFEEK